ncbi:MAG: hypothetical protein ACRCT5_14080 [Tannerellaceae bacterium]
MQRHMPPTTGIETQTGKYTIKMLLGKLMQKGLDKPNARLIFAL